ncbi:hypothetical protein ACSLFT_06405 [Streptomyces sp. G6]|uniref:hypothetical protein n=1 Tax=Streptomyces sp. G6 TaxID=1178736 RepID=UPI003EDAD2B8
MEEEPERPATPVPPTTPEARAADEDREHPEGPAPLTDAAPPTEALPPGDPSGPAEAAGRPRRRGRTALLIAAATALGLVAGTCAGYLVQADREPPPLPPLSQPELARAEGEAAGRLPAAQDRKVRTDGDLRELLLKKPREARQAEWVQGTDGWFDAVSYAETYGRPAEKFSQQIKDEFRRAAITCWEVGDSYTVEIRLVQFWEEEVMAALESTDEARHWTGWQDDTDRWVIPGTGDGEAFVHHQPETEPGFEPVYTAKAFAWRGDIAMEIFISGGEPISKQTIMDVAERQMERL